MSDVNPEVMGLLFIIRAPHLAQNLPMSQYLAGVLHEEAEKGILGGGKLDLFSIEAYEAGGQVDFKAAKTKSARLRPRSGVSLSDAKSGQQFARAKGLC